MKVINIFGGPGAGKSTTAAALFVMMKQDGFRVELVTEFAKTLTYEGNAQTLDNQLAVLGEQDRRLRKLVGKVDFAITDSPLPMQLVYASGAFKGEWFTEAVLGAFHTYDNFNVFLKRLKPFQAYGRNQTEEEAKKLDIDIALTLWEHDREVLEKGVVVAGDSSAAKEIYDRLLT